MQSAGEPLELQQLEAQRQAVLNKGDLGSATKHEMQILATLLNSQFGQAHVDQQQDLVMLQVVFYLCLSCVWSSAISTALQQHILCCCMNPTWLHCTLFVNAVESTKFVLLVMAITFKTLTHAVLNMVTC